MRASLGEVRLIFRELPIVDDSPLIGIGDGPQTDIGLTVCDVDIGNRDFSPTRDRGVDRRIDFGPAETLHEDLACWLSTAALDPAG